MAINKVVFGTETLIDLTGDTVTPEVLLAGYTAHNASGEPVEGDALIPDDVDAALTEKGVTVPDGARISELAALISEIEVGGGGGAKSSHGTYTFTSNYSGSAYFTITHGLGVIPDLVIFILAGVRYSANKYESTVYFAIKSGAKDVVGDIPMQFDITKKNSTNAGSGYYYYTVNQSDGLDTTKSGYLISHANETTFRVSASIMNYFYSGRTYAWFAFGGLT